MKKKAALLLVLVLLAHTLTAFSQSAEETDLDKIWNDYPSTFVPKEGWEYAPQAKIHPDVIREFQTCWIRVIHIVDQGIDVYYEINLEENAPEAVLVESVGTSYHFKIANWNFVTSLYRIQENGPGIAFDAYNEIGIVGVGEWPHYLNVFAPHCIPAERPVANFDQDWAPLFNFGYFNEESFIEVTVNQGRAATREEVAGIIQHPEDMMQEGFIPLGIQTYFHYGWDEALWLTDYGYKDHNQESQFLGSADVELAVNHIYWIQEVVTTGRESTTTDVFCILLQFQGDPQIITFTVGIRSYSTDNREGA